MCLFHYSFFHAAAHHRDLHSFPTRRSSDLAREGAQGAYRRRRHAEARAQGFPDGVARPAGEEARGEPPSSIRDRKSTRLNSSHLGISYAVFCLKKKIQTTNDITANTDIIQT